jgi:hypothetical protein
MSVGSQVGTLPITKTIFFKPIVAYKCADCVEYMDEAKHDEYISELAEAFAAFGAVLTAEVRIRDTYEDGQHKVSWGLVTFNNEVAAQKAVAESASLGQPGWVVRVRQIHFHCTGL